MSKQSGTPLRDPPVKRWPAYLAIATIVLAVIVWNAYVAAVKSQRSRMMPAVEYAKTIKADPRAAAEAESVVFGVVAQSRESVLADIAVLTNRANELLPDSDRAQANELRARFIKYGSNSMTETEIRTMHELNERAANLLPEQDKSRLMSLFKQLSDIAVDSLRRR